MIVPLHNHSMYSALDGFSTPEEIADRVAEIGCPCCGLTDHGVVSGHLEFDKALRKQGIKPIFGCELYHGTKTEFKPRERDQAHLIALAKNPEGLRNLWRLVDCTSDQVHFHNVGRVFWDDLEKYHEGVIFTSACALGLVSKTILNDDFSALNRYLDIVGDDFYIEIHTYPKDQEFRDKETDTVTTPRIINEALVAIASERGIPLVYANDAHYAFAWQYEVHDLYLALQTGDTIFTPIEERSQWHPPQALSIMDEAEVRAALDYLPERAVDEALANSVAIGEMVTAELPSVERHLPVFVPGDCPWLESDSKALSPEDLFVLLVEDGIVARYGENASQEVWDRALYECETLLNDGIHHYFLMGWDEMQAAKDLGIETGPGRGSSAGCIVAYALGITDIDPLHYGLIFERFWNSGRAKGFPDIDSDFARARRQEVIAYLKKRWGADRVHAIGTTGYMKPKSVVDKLYKGFQLHYKQAEALKEIIGKTTKIEILGHKQIGWNPELEPGKVHYVKNDVGDEIEAWCNEPKDPDERELRHMFIEMCEICCSRVQQYGIHASGIVVSDVPLADELPTYRRGGKDKGVPATMFPMTDVDNRMFIKLDVLGLRTLEALEYWRQYMAEKGVDIVWSGLDLEEHPAEMWQLLHDGFTAGIFQVEDGYGRQLCKRMMPASVDDLSVLNALNRPGPIQAGIPEQYVARRNGEEEVTWIHPRLEEILGTILQDTHGLFVYQEQIIAFFNALGYTLSESDAMRKIMGKKQPQDLEAIRDGQGEWEGKGYFAMADRMGIPPEPAEDTWDTIEKFADYCFNKSHTVAYAVIGMRALFAKYYGPAEFYAACMRSYDAADGDTSAKSDRKKKLKMAPQYVNEARRMGIEVRPPSIDKSRAYSWVDDEGVWYFGFEDVLSVGKSGAYICQLRDEIGLDISSPEAFEQQFLAYNDAFNNDRKARKKAGEMLEKAKSPKQHLQAQKIQALYEVGAWQELSPDDRSMTQQQKMEVEYLGVILTDNSREVLLRNSDEIGMCDRYDDATKPWHEKCDDEDLMYLEYKLCGIVSNIQEKRAKKSGQTFGIITIDSPEGEQIEFAAFSNKWKSHKFLFRLRTVGIFTLHHKAPNQWGEQYVFQTGHKLT